jgi:hypothetical protein
MGEWALALGLGLRRTEQRFGPRDGKPRDASAETSASSVEPCKVLGAESADPAARGDLSSAPMAEANHG